MASRITQIASLPVLLFLSTAAAWAGRGDIDPNYGEGGRVSAANAVLLALPGDQLVIGEATDEGFRVRMVDAAGQNVPTFGESGVVLISARPFHSDYAALAPNGDIIFMGSGNDSVRTLLRLDQDGQPVTSFGSSGDGFVETALAATVMAIDPDGKIVLAEGSWEPGYDDVCWSLTRLQRLLADGEPDTGFGGGAIIEIPDLDICSGASVFGARADGGVIVGDGRNIVAVDAAGDIDPAFGVDGRLTVTELASARGVLLPDGGLLLFGSSDEAASSNDTVLLKFDRNGQPDPDFGAGAGSVTVDLGAVLVGMPSSREYVGQLALDPDGEHIVAQLGISHVDGSPACGDGIARLSLDGVPDASFGRNGLTCLNAHSVLIVVQGNGAPLFRAGYSSDSIFRLLPDNSPSPGLLTAMVTHVDVGESAGTASVVIERVAGRDGAASVIFATFDYRGLYRCGYRSSCAADEATAGGDYTATSGRLDWASGDDGQRTVTVRIVDDGIVESLETFGFVFSEPGGGVPLLVAKLSVFYIHDNDTASSSPPPPPDEGGGGSVSWATALALLTLLLMRRRRDRDGTARKSSCCA
jgi:uncharacterized delta-60 repeat protein/MYXO-CTERM domain-containing protein